MRGDLTLIDSSDEVLNNSNQSCDIDLTLIPNIVVAGFAGGGGGFVLYTFSAGSLTSASTHSFTDPVYDTKFDTDNQLLFVLSRLGGVRSYNYTSAGMATSADYLVISNNGEHLDIEPTNQLGIVGIDSLTGKNILSFTYDASGNMTSADSFDNFRPNEEVVFDRNLKNIFFSAQGTEGFISWIIDASGNMTSADRIDIPSESIRGLAIDDVNRTVAALSTAGTVTYKYSTSGIMTSAIDTLAPEVQSWNGIFAPKNMLIVYSGDPEQQAGSGLITALYDDEGMMTLHSYLQIQAFDSFTINPTDEYIISFHGVSPMIEIYSYETSSTFYTDLDATTSGTATSASPYNYDQFANLFELSTVQLLDNDIVRVKGSKILTLSDNSVYSIQADNVKITSWEDKEPWIFGRGSLGLHFVQFTSATSLTIEDLIAQYNIGIGSEDGIYNCIFNVNNCIFLDDTEFFISVNSILNANGCSFNNENVKLLSTRPE